MVRKISAEESGLKLTRDGLWLHNGAPFTHSKTPSYFHRQIRKDEEGKFYVLNEFKSQGLAEHAYFEVEECAYHVEGIDLVSLEIILNTEHREILDPSTLREGRDASLYCTLQSTDEARFAPSVAYQLVPLTTLVGDQLYINLQNNRYHITPR